MKTWTLCFVFVLPTGTVFMLHSDPCCHTPLPSTLSKIARILCGQQTRDKSTVAAELPPLLGGTMCCATCSMRWSQASAPQKSGSAHSGTGQRMRLGRALRRWMAVNWRV